MFDLSSKFNTFYADYVVLPKTEQDKLHDKKALNIQRLKDGLKEYNEENKTSYYIVETCVQGSMAMSTVVQNEDHDYDIDVAIVFKKSDLGSKGAQATRNMVANALRRKTKQFNAEPEVKTSCVRVKYADGYHIDFAVYRKYYDVWNDCWVYEHAGSDWTQRELKGLSEWFKTQNDASDGKLRKVVRLSKMFCKSRASWKNMPSGLLQTVLCDEKLQNSYERIDELFYYTMSEIVKRLESNTAVSAPVDNGRDLTPRQSDITRMTNWKNRLKSKLEDLEVLFKDDCSREDALQAWYGFFNHDFWNEQPSETSSYSAKVVLKSIRGVADTEQYIEDLFPVHLSHRCNKIPIDKSSRNDYRLRMANKNLRKFVKRFDGEARREQIDNLGREFKEELIETGIVNWTKIKYRVCGRHITELQFGQHFQIYELLLADVVELIPTVEQENDLRKLMCTPSDAYYFATEEEIKSLGIDTATKKLKEVIADHTLKILQENEGDLTKVPGAKEKYTVNLN